MILRFPQRNLIKIEINIILVINYAMLQDSSYL